MARAFCELNEAGNRICVWFAYDAHKKDQVKNIPGKRFHPAEEAGEDGAHWSVPLDLDAAKALRIIFGHELVLGNAVRAWGREEAQRIRNLGSLSVANDAELKRLPKVNPLITRIINGEPIPEFKLPKSNALSRKRPPRPYQRADIALMAQNNVINANQPGTGKTLEAIGALVEAGIENGPHLVAAPRASLVNTWKVEVERLLGQPVYTSDNAQERRKQVALGLEQAQKGQACWLLVLFDDLRVKKVISEDEPPEERDAMAKLPLFACRDHKGAVYHFQNEQHKTLVKLTWNSFITDEFHKSGLNNPMSLFTIGTDLIKAQRRYPMSGTPMGGKPINLFPVLRSIDPKKYSSKWRWAGEWLEIETGYGGHKKINGLKPGIENEFYEAHKHVMVRRMKREALPGLPPKTIEVVMCPMTPKQAKQYNEFDDNAETTIEGVDGENGETLVVGDCILAEYSRLKQFANAYCKINERNEVVPTEDSGKLPYLLEKLDEFGIRKVDPEPNARAIVASQSLRMVEMVSKWLTGKGIPNNTLTGKTKDTSVPINQFKREDGKPFVLVMTTETGGVSLNLEEADSVHILDESWNPDNEEQLEDRGDRGGRENSLVCIYYRTQGTVQEYIADVAEGKRITNKNVLDLYRQLAKLRTKEKV